MCWFFCARTPLICRRTRQTLFVSTKAALTHHTPLILPRSLKLKWDVAMSSAGSLDRVYIIRLSLTWSPEAFESSVNRKGSQKQVTYHDTYPCTHTKRAHTCGAAALSSPSESWCECRLFVGKCGWDAVQPGRLTVLPWIHCGDLALPRLTGLNTLFQPPHYYQIVKSYIWSTMIQMCTLPNDPFSSNIWDQ